MLSFTFQAIFAFQGNRDDGELSFDIGDEIEIISEIEEWYNGRTKDGQTGAPPIFMLFISMLLQEVAVNSALVIIVQEWRA